MDRENQLAYSQAEEDRRFVIRAVSDLILLKNEISQSKPSQSKASFLQ